MPFWINIIVALLSFAVAAIGGKGADPLSASIEIRTAD